MSSLTGSRHSLAGIFARWERLLAGAEANRDDLPALEPYRAQLAAALADTKEAHERRMSLQVEACQATQDLRARIGIGRELTARLESGVRLSYGRRSPKLVEFGMKTLLRRVKPKARAGCGMAGCPLEATATAK
jgi:hypothetical protein